MAIFQNHSNMQEESWFIPHTPELAMWMEGTTISQGKPVKAESKFTFINQLGRPYENTKPCVKAIRFALSRNGKYHHTLHFPTMLTEKDAINKAEIYLAEPLDQKYYEVICDDLLHQVPWRQARDWFKVRGECLSDGVILNSASLDGLGSLTIQRTFQRST